jgi:hypothetical protein
MLILGDRPLTRQRQNRARRLCGRQPDEHHSEDDDAQAIEASVSSMPVPRRYTEAHGRVNPRPGVASASNLVPKSATSDGDKAKGPALPVAVLGEIPWQEI